MWKVDPSKIITREQREAEALDAAWAKLRADRDQKISDTMWLVQRHIAERAMDRETTLSGEQFEALMEWHQALRDLPANTVDPASAEWPAQPLTTAQTDAA